MLKRSGLFQPAFVFCFFHANKCQPEMLWGELDKMHLSCNLRKHSQIFLCSLPHPKVDAQSLQEITAHSQQLISTLLSANAALWPGSFHKVIHSAWNLPKICNKSQGLLNENVSTQPSSLGASEGVNWITSWRLFSSLDMNILGCSISYPTGEGLQNPREKSFGRWNEGNVAPWCS